MNIIQFLGGLLLLPIVVVVGSFIGNKLARVLYDWNDRRIAVASTVIAIVGVAIMLLGGIFYD